MSETNSVETNPVERIVMFFRRHLQCRFGVHWNMKYDNGMANDIGRGGTCLDCGYTKEKIKWPRCESCINGYDGTNGNGYQPCGCDPDKQLNPTPPSSL